MAIWLGPKPYRHYDAYGLLVASMLARVDKERPCGLENRLPDRLLFRIMVVTDQKFTNTYIQHRLY